MTQVIKHQDAPFPTNYQSAKTSLQECSKVDECKGWADKAIALASYAKQANDEELLWLSNRIKARAIERMGQLFEQVKPGKGNQHSATEGRVSAAEAAGISQDQRKQAQTIARFARERPHEFEALVEGDNPPTLESLANISRGGRSLSLSTEALGSMKRFAEFCKNTPPDAVVDSLLEHEVATVMHNAKTIVEWLTKLSKLIGETDVHR